MSELAQIRLIALVAALAIVVCWRLARAFAGRRKARFFTMARALSAQPEATNEFLYRFDTTVDGRPFEVRCQHIGGGGQDGSNWTPDWYLVTSTNLHGVSDLHSADVRPRSRRNLGASTPTADDFVVRDSGYPLRDGWLTAGVARALRDFYAPRLPLEPLCIEEGKVVHRSRFLLRRLDGPALRQLLVRQGAVASALEQAV